MRLPLLSAPALASLLALTASCESENAVACRDFEQSYNALPCAAGTDPGVDCNAFADYPCPIDDYFTCLEQSYTCDENGELRVNVTRDAGPGVPATTCADLLDCEG